MSYVIDKIKKAHSVTSYLKTKGHEPVKVDSSKSSYHCPLHSGDKTPSFFVHHKEEGDDFYCWACKKGGSIIQLYSDLEGISVRDAIFSLAENLNIDINDQLVSTIEKDLITSIKNHGEISENNIEDEIIIYLIEIGSLLRQFLQRINFNEEEESRCERVLKILEELARKQDLDEISKIAKNMPQILKARYAYIKSEIEKQRKSELQGWNI